MQKKYLIILLLFVSIGVYADELYQLEGIVSAKNGIPVEGASVILEPGKKGQTSNDAGEFSFSDLEKGEYFLHVQHIGYPPQTLRVQLNRDTHIVVQLSSSATRLEGVEVTGRTQTQEVARQVITAKVLEIKSQNTTPATLTEIMNRSSGIRIRESGGLGSNADISINGFQGRAVRYFKDGIPLDYLGDGYTIANLPLNTLERVEVYKGVLPVSLGSDALGGAVNLVSNTSPSPFLNTAYEIGSFNTHRASLVGHYVNKEQTWFAGTETFYNYSKNDYRVDVRVPDPETKNPSWQSVRLFNNGYEGYYSEVYAGLKNRKWADEVRLGIAAYGIDREQQHPTLMNTPYGNIALNQSALVPTLRYKKDLFGDKIKVDQFFAYSRVQKNRVDTTKGSYDWYGNFTSNSYKVGESPQPALSEVYFHNLTSRTNIGVQLHPRHTIQGNLALTRTRRKGRDPFGLRFSQTDIDILSVPATYFKLVGGMGWEYTFLNDMLTNSFNAKFFSYRSKGINGFRTNESELSDIKNTSGTSWGVAEGLKFTPAEDHLFRLSVEYTNRLPDQEELFGNSDTKVPNFGLRPERSLNVNFNHRFQKERYQIETSILYRRTKNLILLIPIQPPYAQYQNLENVKGYGFDIDACLRLYKDLSLTGNFTWLDNRVFDLSTSADKWKEGTRLRNTPFFFYNVGATGTVKGSDSREDHFKIYAYYNFIREFYLDFIPKNMEPKGFMGLWGKSGVDITTRIPDQHFFTAGVNYEMGSMPFVLAFEIKNITNAKLYDFYRVQKAGRSYQLKINYLISKNK